MALGGIDSHDKTNISKLPWDRKWTRPTLAIILIGAYSIMWTWIVVDVISDPDHKGFETIGEFAGIISTMTVLVTLVVQFYFRRSGPKDDDPLSVLKKRLAKGEITQKQYDELVKKIQE